MLFLSILISSIIMKHLYLATSYSEAKIHGDSLSGIIRKTRTVMECLHRFCRECIDKSMRLGYVPEVFSLYICKYSYFSRCYLSCRNNECPACRTHCASRRSLRDDPNYDALIATLYPDIDKYEEEELAFHEEEKSRNKKVASPYRIKALGRRRSTAKAAAVFGRKPQGSYRNHLLGRGRSIGGETAAAGSDDEEEEANGNDVTKDTSSADEPSPERRPKRCKRWGAPRSSPARTVGSGDVGSEENDDFEVNREPLGTSPLRAGNREMLAWGKNGTRSQTRHSGTSGLNGRLVKGGRMAKLVDYLRNLDEADDEYSDDFAPKLESVDACVQFIALQTSVQAEEVEMYVRKPQCQNLAVGASNSMDEASADPSIGLQMVEGQESLAAICASFMSDLGEMVRCLNWYITDHNFAPFDNFNEKCVLFFSRCWFTVGRFRAR
ncbi:hypothetical protein BHE74_00031880 [Ensete ventricosum]|nr:hypothetical protein GW17_00020435 [Ensete ventricosum]RWW61107.1 hypothetical protein BHE74_00031880 [Ensete ventricosum]RZS08918.1 hypothetical protein BHM03_00039948 [Ensete ventricosum]